MKEILSCQPTEIRSLGTFYENMRRVNLKLNIMDLVSGLVVSPQSQKETLFLFNHFRDCLSMKFVYFLRILLTFFFFLIK